MVKGEHMWWIFVGFFLTCLCQSMVFKDIMVIKHKEVQNIVPKIDDNYIWFV